MAKFDPTVTAVAVAATFAIVTSVVLNQLPAARSQCRVVGPRRRRSAAAHLGRFCDGPGRAEERRDPPLGRSASQGDEGPRFGHRDRHRG